MLQPLPLACLCPVCLWHHHVTPGEPLRGSAHLVAGVGHSLLESTAHLQTLDIYVEMFGLNCNERKIKPLFTLDEELSLPKIEGGRVVGKWRTNTNFLQRCAYFTEKNSFFFLLLQDMTHKNVDFPRDHVIKCLSDIFLCECLLLCRNSHGKFPAQNIYFLRCPNGAGCEDQVGLFKNEDSICPFCLHLFLAFVRFNTH